MFIPDLLT